MLVTIFAFSEADVRMGEIKGFEGPLTVRKRSFGMVSVNLALA